MRIVAWLRALFRRREPVPAKSLGLVELVDDQKQSQGALVCYPRSEAKLIIDSFKQRELQGTSSFDGNVGAALADGLATTSPLIAAGLSTGQMFQIVGSPAVAEGLRNGTLAMIRSGPGVLGSVTSAGGGQIVGQARFVPVSMAPVVAPLAAWQVLHAVAGTSQLVRINRRLDVMQRSIERLLVRQEAAILGEVRSAAAILDDLLAEHRQVGSFSTEMTVRLALVEQTVGSLLQRNRILVEAFRQKAARVTREGGKGGAAAAATLITEEGAQALNDMDLLVGLMRLDLEVERARIRQALEMSPLDVPRRFAALQERVGIYQEVLADRLSIGQIQAHARACVDEMSWWQRKVSARGIVRAVRDANQLQDDDGGARALAVEPSLEPRPDLIIWRDESGRNQARLLSVISGEDDLPTEALGDGRDRGGADPSDPFSIQVAIGILTEGHCPDCGQRLWWKTGSGGFPHCGKAMPIVHSPSSV